MQVFTDLGLSHNFWAIKSSALVPECKLINQLPSDLFGTSISVYIHMYFSKVMWASKSSQCFHYFNSIFDVCTSWWIFKGNVWVLLGFGWPGPLPFANFDLSILLHTWCLHEIPKLSKIHLCMISILIQIIMASLWSNSGWSRVKAAKSKDVTSASPSPANSPEALTLPSFPVKL